MKRLCRRAQSAGGSTIGRQKTRQCSIVAAEQVRGRHAQQASNMSGHVALMREPGGERYPADRQVSLRQQQTCPLDADREAILEGLAVRPRPAAITSSGNARSTTVRAFTPEEFGKIAAEAPAMT